MRSVIPVVRPAHFGKPVEPAPPGHRGRRGRSAAPARRPGAALVLATLAVFVCVALLPTPVSGAPFFGEKGAAFPEGTKAFELNAAYIAPIRFSDDHFYGANVAAHYYFGNEVSIGAELQGYYVDQVRDDTVLGGASLLLRWHFLAADDYTLFIDAAGGVSLAGTDVPETGTHFNYTPKIGGGATFKLRDDVHLLGGVRFFHLSNANLNGRDENPSQDGVQFFVGVLWTF